jgi:hypothetical protein
MIKITESKICIKIELHKNYTRNIIHDERSHDKKEQKSKKKDKPTKFYFSNPILMKQKINTSEIFEKN